MKFTPLSFSAGAVADRVLTEHRRILLLGESGIGKTTLLCELARYAVERSPVTCIDCELGLPAFGPPGAAACGRWDEDGWQLEAFEPLCSLDAARFRLPLVQAVAQLLRRRLPGTLFVNTPGLVRGMAAAELLTAVSEIMVPDAVVVLHRSDGPIPLVHELNSLDIPVFTAAAHRRKRAPDAATRARIRTRAWDRYLARGHAVQLALQGMRVLGAAPPGALTEPWLGRQVALGCADRWIGFGEVTKSAADMLELRVVGEANGADRLLVRDAGRDANQQLRTRRMMKPGPTAKLKQATRAPFELRCGPLVATLVNGVTGDPLLMLRQRHRHGAILFDVGDAHALSQRLLHTVTDVFVSHAHLDHLAGFPYLLRSRLSAVLPPLRMYGPAGTHEHIAGILAGTRWDRIGADGPEFEVHELDAGRLQKFHLQAGGTSSCGPATDAAHGILLQTPELSVRAVELDHGIPVLAFALEMLEQHNVDSSWLTARRLRPGPWIGDLKANLRRGDLDALIQLPDGSVDQTGNLAGQMLMRVPGPKIVYATDFSDHVRNRRVLAEFARRAALLFCESTFRAADRVLAERTQHLTTRACAEIASAAQVERLVPFHFSKRYEGYLDAVYGELESAGGAFAIERHRVV